MISQSILKTIFDNINFITDKTKIVITIDDFKYIPELSKVISFEKISKTGVITLSELTEQNQNKVIYIFLKKYNFIQKFNKYYYFDYTMMYEFWENLEYYNSYFRDKEPDLIISINKEEHKLYKWDKIDFNMQNYIGLMFFSAFNKIKENYSINTKEYEYFTDINFNFNNYSIITDFKKFFLKEFYNFIKTNHGSVFGNYDFGSNLKNYIQSKKSLLLYEKIKADIVGFINDLSYLYKNVISLINFDIIDIDDYNIKIIVTISLNEEIINYEILSKG